MRDEKAKNDLRRIAEILKEEKIRREKEIIKDSSSKKEGSKQKKQ